MSVYQLNRLKSGDLENSATQNPDDFSFPHERPAATQRGVSDSSFDRGTQVLDSVQNDIGGAGVVEFVKRTSDHPNRLSRAPLSGDQIAAANRISAQYGPGVIQHMKYGGSGE